MCSGPVSTITECGPITGATGELPAPDGATSGGAVNTVFTASGSPTTTICIPLGKNVSVKHSPTRFAQRSMNHVGASAHASVCTIAGARGPGGSLRSLGAPSRAGSVTAASGTGAAGPATAAGSADGLVLAIPTT